MGIADRRRRAPRRPARWCRALAWALLAALQLAPPGLAFAAPAGEQVVSGSAEFERSGDLTHITTHSRDTIVNYTGFDIWSHESVQIDQPDAGSRILNRVLSTDPTFIEGRLFSNGQVWVVNPVGVFVGSEAVVDVGSLVAAAGHVSDVDFLGGRDRFTALAGDVEVAPGALIRAADRVLLVGAHVANYGNISAPDGMVAFAAGGEVRLARVDGRVVITADRLADPDPARWGIEQAGTLEAQHVSLSAGDAYSLAMNHSGITRAREIHVDGGGDGLTQVAGRLDASSDAPDATGGRIDVLGDRVALLGAELDVSGPAGGGRIRVGGDLRGEGTLRTATRSYVSPDAVLRADATERGHGGSLVVWSDDATRFFGEISARGGSAGGDGGFAEISGKQSLVSHGRIDLGADAGAAGTLLYDPLHILVRGGALDGEDLDTSAAFLAGDGSQAGTVAVGDTGGGGDPFVIYESEIEGTDANIVLAASRSIRSEGSFAGDEVTVAAGRDLSMSVVDDDGDLAPGETLGIDLSGHDGAGQLTWSLSDGGRFVLTTQAADGRSADIQVGSVVTRGVREGAGTQVSIAANGAGDVAVASIRTSGADRDGDVVKTVFGRSVNTLDAGGVAVATESGSVAVGSVEAVGGNATTAANGRGDGGNGGAVVLSASEGSLDVGTIDVSGGAARVQLVDGEPDGRGGAGGSISLIADLDPQGEATEPPGADPHVIAVTGDLLARGGAGLGTETVVTPSSGGSSDDSQVFGAAGGRGGQIFASAGLTAGEGRIVLGSAASPIEVGASGGDGTAAGGATASGGASAFSGAAIGAIRLEAHGDVETHAVLAARGGDASVGGAGGFGGHGGDVSIGSEAGDVSLNDTAASASVVTDGGSGWFDATRVLRDGVPNFGGQGGSAGSFTAETAGDGGAIALLGEVQARGGAGTQGAGGAGGNVTATALDGAIIVSDVDASGGSGTGSAGAGAITPQGVKGGNGGNIVLTTQAGEDTPSAGGGDLRLGGSLVSIGGSGEPDPDGDIVDPRENHGVGGSIRLTSVQDVVAAGATAPTLRGGSVEVTGEDIFAGGGSDLLLSAAGDAAPESAVDRATVTARGAARVRIDDDAAQLFDRLELVQRDATGSMLALLGGGATVIASGSGAAGSFVHTIDAIDTTGLDVHLTYRLADPAGGVDVIDARTLAVASGAVAFGDAGGKLANARADAAQPEGERLLGRIEGAGAGPQVDATGNLELVGTGIGGLAVAGAAGPDSVVPFAELNVAGDVDLTLSGVFAALDLTQRRAQGDVAIALPGGDAVSIDGSVEDTGASRIETSRVLGVDTTASGIGFFYHLAGATASSSDTDRGEPTLTIGSGAVALGGSGGFATTGDLRLEGDSGPAVDANGNALWLLADANLDGRGALEASGAGPAAVDVAALVAIAGEGVGSDGAPLRVVGTGGPLALAGSGGSGDFRIENGAATGELEIVPIALTAAHAGVSEQHTVRGVHAGGEVVLENGGRDIRLGEIQPGADDSVFVVSDRPGLAVEGSTSGSDRLYGFGDLRVAASRLAAVDSGATAPHVSSGGGQRYAGSVLLANPRTVETTSVDPYLGEVTEGSTLNAVRLVAGGDVVFEGDVDTPGGMLLPGADRTQLVIDAGGTTAFGGDIGSSDAGRPTIDSLVVGASRFGAGPHAVTVGNADFRGALDGPGALALRGIGAASELTFRGDVGAGEALASFDADADRLVFGALDGGSSADRVVAGTIALNTATPAGAIPDTATIADTSNGLSLESAGTLSIGAREKLSATGPLAITAGGTATVGDLAATSLQLVAPQIVIQGRAPAPVRLASGATVRDRGVDWVANDIATSIVPEWDGVGTPPTLVVGSGGVWLGGGPLPFDAVRFDARLSEIGAASFSGGDPLLDLTGTGPRLAADASEDVPRGAATVAAPLAARFSDTAPAPPPELSAEQVLGYVRCQAPDGGPCGPDASSGVRDFDDSALATERAREIVLRYHDLIASPSGRHELASAFAPLSRTAESGDGRALYRTLATTRGLGDARHRIDELAHVLAEISLLGLDEPGTERVRRAVAEDFARATNLPGLDAEAALEAANASGVGALP